MTSGFLIDRLAEQVRGYPDKLRAVREILLANAVMFGEIPAPSGQEEARVRFLTDRFRESGLQNISVDEAGNAVGILPGKDEDRRILVFAHLDTVFEGGVDHTISAGTDRLSGPGIGDNSLGVALVASLPKILEEMGIELEATLVLLGTTRSLGKGDLAGIRFFLEHSQIGVDAAICIEGTQLGRLSYSSLGMLRGEIVCETEPSSGGWKSHDGAGAIAALTRITQRILALPTPEVPKTAIILGSVMAGTSFNLPANRATLRFEVRSEQAGMISQMHREISLIVEEIDAEGGTEAELSILARRRPGGIPFAHPLVQSTRRFMGDLGFETQIAPSVGELAAIIQKEIPGITLGLTKGGKRGQFDEYVEIEPVFSGVAQLLGVLQAIDGGVCHEED